MHWEKGHLPGLRPWDLGAGSWGGGGSWLTTRERRQDVSAQVTGAGQGPLGVSLRVFQSRREQGGL